jgi:hypothetical protein
MLVGEKERLLLALSSRTGADRERQQRIGYDAFAEPTMNERFLRTPDRWSGREWSFVG